MLCVRSGQQTARWVYDFRVDPDWDHGLEQDDALFEPNNTERTAYPIELGEPVESTIEEGPADYIDCFRFDVEQDVAYSLTMDLLESSAGSLTVSVASESEIVLLDDAPLTTGINDLEFSGVRSEQAILCVTAGQRTARILYTFTIE